MDYSGLDNAALWALAVGFLAPPVISVIQQSKWSRRTQSWVAFGFCLVLGTLTAWFTGLFTITDIGRLALLVFLSSAASYQALWKPTGISPAIEAVTPPPDPEHRLG
jgi:hypothetical protein